MSIEMCAIFPWTCMKENIGTSEHGPHTLGLLTLHVDLGYQLVSLIIGTHQYSCPSLQVPSLLCMKDYYINRCFQHNMKENLWLISSEPANSFK